ncbi:hypothetical protein OUZ56_029953 [Daphnia magna]|uniref:Uncharacterized protein n=1 Tax=Daphnia magna TaxID=35525 RepID=A0ABR0B8A8_9CRUS|nr:hypothetical protein OUZ56_029953 [Daphnia magna]
MATDEGTRRGTRTKDARWPPPHRVWETNGQSETELELPLAAFTIPNSLTQISLNDEDDRQVQLRHVRFCFGEICHRNCIHEPTVYNDVYSTLPQITRFVGHSCTMWLEKKHIYTDFWGWQTPSQSRVPIKVNAHECEKMRDSRLYHGKSMDYLGNNKWSFERIPNVQGSWLQVTADQLINCRLEEVTLETECANCTISSPIGDIPVGINGSVSHNLVTIVWKESLREVQQCKLRLVETGIAQRYLTNNSEIERIHDVEQQLDFVYNTTNKEYCNSSEKSYKQIIGMDKVILRLHSLTDTNAHPSKPLEEDLEKIADIIRAEISGVAHSQYARD